MREALLPASNGMDIFSHGLWAGVAYKAINKKLKKTFNVWLAIFWGVFPDMASFGVLFVFFWLMV